MPGYDNDRDGGYSASRSSGGYRSSDKRYTPMNGSRSGGGGGSSRGSGCFKCGEDGHFSRECPKSGGGGGGGRSCYKCGEEGHISRDCPKGGGGGDRSCYKCGEEGHISRDCPKGGGGGGGGNDECFNCGKPGHFSRECPSKRGGGRFNDSSSSLPSFGGRGGDKPRSDFGIKFGDAGAGLSKVDWSKEKLASFERNFYTESESTAQQTDEDVESWRKEHDIQCVAGYQDKMAPIKFGSRSKSSSSSAPLPNPVMNFSETAFPKQVMRAIEKAGFEHPTPIQSATWPMVLGGKNVIGIARTGSGKTLAFLLPGVVHLCAQERLQSGDGPIALIIAPTRELACQIEGEVAKFASHVRHCCVYGGVKKYDQLRNLRRGSEIVIATPGRLLDFMESGVTNLKRVTYAVIDEADRLLDMGFEPQLNAIMNQIRPDRQMLMFSATWPKEVRALAKKYLIPDGDDSNVCQVAIGGAFDKLQANVNVTQRIQFVDRGGKISELKKCVDEQMEKSADSKILVFISTKKMCNYMADKLWDDGYWVCAIHGDKEQRQRDKALNDFKTGKMKIMLATDVAARGIHIDDIKLVVNFDMPNAIEDYVHRIGRTGRAGKEGVALSFFDKDQDGGRAKDLIKVLKDAKQDIPEELYSCKSNGRNGGRNRYSRYQGRRW
eukprot:CAMPEP_0202725900 /NCGR_PEP_ID=MMETSP1385-20130828/184336_1 /ASSEMBLY_ACC=CAM_ASM_000861 /TAXON_ID=933848 /ORGANISM="Elphidium margaritaceum" /LENGTH=662 /DNA_ID=CAMNT_0049392105 /DNA_START=268 /DNA_END=2256 /DNA_ORIENTATION=+